LLERGDVRIKNILIFLGVFLIIFSVSSWGKSEETNLKLISSFEGGNLYQAGPVDILELRGSYHQMGRQYGKLLKEKLPKYYQIAIKETFIEEVGLSFESMIAYAKMIFDSYPKRFQDIIYGMAETSEMELEKLIAMNSIVCLPELSQNELHCSGIAVWGEYTEDGGLVFGRNFDYPKYFKKFNKFITVVIYNPEDANPTATFGYPCQIETIHGINKHGLFLEINDGTLSGGEIIGKSGIPPLIMNLAFLLDSSNMRQIDAAISSYRASSAIILNVADKNGACSYECSIWDTRKNSGERQGLLVSTNHFLEPSWNIPKSEGGHWKSITRRRNLLALCQKYKGQLNARKMIEILDMPLEKGGATREYWTIQQLVVIPEELKVWIKVLGFTDWVSLDLSKFFITSNH